MRNDSSTKPFCFFRIGRTLSLMASASCVFLPGLLVSSTTRVNICALLSLVEWKGTRRERNGDGKGLPSVWVNGTPPPTGGQLPEYGAMTRWLSQLDVNLLQVQGIATPYL